MEKKSEDHLKEEFSQRHEDAFSKVFSGYKTELIIEAFYIIEDMEAAKDLVQELFIKLWSRGTNLDIRENLYGYLLHSIRNNSISYLKKTKTLDKRKEKLSYFLNTTTDQNPLENKELGGKINKAIEAISAPACRKVFTAAYIDGKSNKEISKELNIKVQVVKNQISKALRIVRGKLKQH